MITYCWPFVIGLGAQEAPRRRTWDSAGISIVEYRSMSQVSGGLHLARKPFFSVGGLSEDPRREFSANHWSLTAARLGNGNVVVMDEYELKFFSEDGRLLRVSGRRGRGPGEFLMTRDLCRIRGDTLLIVDANDGRLSIWSGNGDHVKTYARAGFTAFDSCRNDGAVIIRGGPNPRDDEQSPDYRLIRADGTVLGRLGKLAEPRYVSPVMTEPSIVPIPGGYVVGDGRRFAFRRVRNDGTIAMIVRSSEPQKRLSQSEWLELARRTWPTSAATASRVANGDTLRTLPAYSTIKSDQIGRVWVLDYAPPRKWTVFGPDGGILGRFSLESGFGFSNSEIVRTESDHVVIRRKDSDGAVYLEFHRILTGSR